MQTEQTTETEKEDPKKAAVTETEEEVEETEGDGDAEEESGEEESDDETEEEESADDESEEEGSKKEANGEDEEYELEAPEGTRLSEMEIKSIALQAKEDGLSPEQAKKLLVRADQ